MNTLYRVINLPRDAPCKYCGANEGYLLPRGPHIGLYCIICDHWLRWVPKQEAKHYSLDGKVVEKPSE